MINIIDSKLDTNINKNNFHFAGKYYLFLQIRFILNINSVKTHHLLIILLNVFIYSV
ncbi:hypothetical protein HNQ00_000609 [Flavobacterium sp. 14A]|nr:hypothetical protein [Flavobacterium sp. 14A]